MKVGSDLAPDAQGAEPPCFICHPGRRTMTGVHATGGDTMNDKRQNAEKEPGSVLKRQLNDDQRLTLAELEGFGWELKFIRRPLFQDPVPVVFDSDRKRFAVLERDGTLNESPGFDIRH